MRWRPYRNLEELKRTHAFKRDTSFLRSKCWLPSNTLLFLHSLIRSCVCVWVCERVTCGSYWNCIREFDKWFESVGWAPIWASQRGDAINSKFVKNVKVFISHTHTHVHSYSYQHPTTRIEICDRCSRQMVFRPMQNWVSHSAAAASATLPSATAAPRSAQFSLAPLLWCKLVK